MHWHGMCAWSGQACDAQGLESSGGCAHAAVIVMIGAIVDPLCCVTAMRLLELACCYALLFVLC
jgi:hypothetical protein